jgi:diguanylate cyclase (GGDEF)-like protein/PAS domain S-box-containing protein
MMQRTANAEAPLDEKARAEETLNSIGDAIVSTDVRGRVTYLNVAGERMTGWSRHEAAGRPMEEIFRIVDASTRNLAPNPMPMAIRENKAFALTADCVLVRRDGVETAIEDSTAPIHDLDGRVTGAVMVFHDVSLARSMSLKMSYLAQHDSLTDLPNRVLFNDRLNRAIAMARRRRERLAVLFLDLDRFKHVNDSLGHDVGDRLLKSVTRRLLGCIRNADTVSRQGGDEFVFLLSELGHAQDAAVCAQKILAALGTPHAVDQHALIVTASIGIATYPDDGVDADTLLREADTAMHSAKEGGRDSYQFFTPEMNTRAIDRQLLERNLRQAIERDEFVLHYQPIVNLQTLSIVAVEALLRWQHPQRGLLAPAQFMPLAEECGAIVPIGAWALREACRQTVAWQTAKLLPLQIAVNVSAAELNHKGFVAGVGAILAHSGLEPRYLELELTETFLLHDSTSTAVTLHALKDLGVRLTLDDFGTGYSSLNHLKRFPIDGLKIDRSFIGNLASDASDCTIVSAIINMGLGLKIRTIAEGVATSEQLAFLRERSCQEGQGHFFHPPMPAGDIAPLLARTSNADARS